MSHEATNWAIKQRGLTPPAKIVLWHLCDRYHPDNGCFPSQDRLMQDCEISRSSLNTHLKALEEAGLIRREKRRDDRTNLQKSTFYRFAFEPDFVPMKPPDPCPDIGHGREVKSVSNSGPEPCPNSGEIRVQNLDTNPVRGTSKRTSNEREGVREGADGEKTETVSVETWKRRFRKAHADWPTYADDSPEPTEKAWFALNEAERDQAVALQSAYVHHVKTVLKRQAICRYSVYLREKRWEKLPEKVAKVSGAKPGVAAPFGKMWGAVRLVELSKPPAPFGRNLTQLQEQMIAKGLETRQSILLKRQALSGWPVVATMHERAIRRHLGWAGSVGLEPLLPLFVQVEIGSPIWNAWRQLHADRGWPWFGSDHDCPPYVWMPAPPGEPPEYSSAEDAVRAAMTRFETEHETITQKDAAE